MALGTEVRAGNTLAGDADSMASLGELMHRLRKRWQLVAFVPLGLGLLALGIAFLIPPTYTAKTVFVPPQQPQNAAGAALASLGALSALAGGGSLVRTPADQYVSLLQSTTVADRLIDRHKLLDVYGVERRFDARLLLSRNLRAAVGKRDGLVFLEVDDENPQRAADLANHAVDELRSLTASLAITEAQQRRAFFERLLVQARESLAKAQQALQSSGFSEGALRSEPRVAAENYARTLAQVTTTEVRLKAMRDSLADDAPEVKQLVAMLAALRAELARAETANRGQTNTDYVGRYREYKYQETLFDLYARQFELARADESREGALIQVVDVAQPPERRARPKRAMIAVLTTLVAGVLTLLYCLLRPLPSRPGRRLDA